MVETLPKWHCTYRKDKDKNINYNELSKFYKRGTSNLPDDFKNKIVERNTKAFWYDVRESLP